MAARSAAASVAARMTATPAAPARMQSAAFAASTPPIAITGCFLAGKPDEPLAAAAEALVAFGLAGEDAAEGARGPGSFHVGLYDALAALDPETLDGRARVER